MSDNQHTAWDVALEAFHELDSVERVQTVFDSSDPEIPLVQVTYNRGTCLLVSDVWDGDKAVGYTYSAYASEWTEDSEGDVEVLGMGGDTGFESLLGIIRTFSEK